MYKLKIIRHGAKNNDPEAHLEGVGALLDPNKIPKIKTFAEQQSERLDKDTVIETETTPVDRAVATGNIIVSSMKEGFLSLATIMSFSINDLLGSYALHPTNREAVSLSPKTMSEMWANAKKGENYKQSQAEHEPLYAWCEQGFDNPQANNPQDPGISLREIASRIGAYAYNKLNAIQAAKTQHLNLSIGHSGDIEPFLYLCLEMLDGRDGSGSEAMIRHFLQTGGALEPLTGITLIDDRKRGLYLRHLKGKPDDQNKGIVERAIGLEIFQQQAQWYDERGMSQQVLEQKIEKENVSQ